MKHKRTIIAWALLIMSACASNPVRPPAPTVRTVTVTVKALDGTPVVGARVVLANAPEPNPTNSEGLAYVINTPSVMTESRLTVFADGFFDWSSVLALAPGDTGLSAALTPRPPPAPPLPEKRSVESLVFVQANFCNLPDESGKPQFTPFIISLPKEQRALWYTRQAAAGSTHIVLSPSISYPGAPWPNANLYDNAPAFVDFVQEALETPAADGKGFTPILILDPGDRDPRPRISRTWPAIIAELRTRGLLDSVIIVPGWELITASDWNSGDLSFGLELLHTLGVPHMWMHLSPGRAAGSSNPVVPSDPWQGAEAGFWKEHGGQYLEGFLYESENITEDRNPAACDASQAECWLNRWEDVVPRLGNGMNGWRIVHLTLFETVAWGAWNGRASQKYAQDVATAGKKMCDKYHVKCGFGNGLPH